MPSQGIRVPGALKSMLAIVLAGMIAVWGCRREPPTDAGHAANSGSQTRLRIAVVPKGTTHEFWRTVEAGARKAASELGVTMTFRGPEREDDRSQQISLVQNLIGSGSYDAIVLAPLDDRALVGPVKEAAGAGIPVVIFDSGLDESLATAGADFVSLVATDNFEGGRLAADAMAAALGGQGRVLMLRYAEGSASTLLREKGFTEGLAGHTGITLVDPRRFAGATRATAQDASENLLSAHPDIDGVFCSNESASFGMLLALRSRGLAGKVKFVGFDSGDAFIDAVHTGHMHAFVVQNPMRMGYLAVKAAVGHVQGERVEPRIDTGVAVVTIENIDSPELSDILRPATDRTADGP